MRLMPTTLAILLGSILVGCVAQADYDQLMVANKAALAEREAAEQRAFDAETKPTRCARSCCPASKPWPPAKR